MKLSEAEKLNFKQRLRKQISGDERVRINVLLLIDREWTYEMISSALYLSEGSISGYLKEYEAKGKLKNEVRGGSEAHLKEEQKKVLSDHLELKTYSRTFEIRDWIQKEFHIFYSLKTVYKILHALDFRYKRPIKCPAKLNPEAQQRWIEDYKKLKKALKSDEHLLFLDAVHPDHQTQSVRGWIKKGSQKAVPTTAYQKRVHWIGAIEVSQEKRECFFNEYETIDTTSFVDFLKKLMKKYESSQKLILILDNASYHKSFKLKEFVKKVAGRLELRYLPPYSPNLNLSERLWKLMREHVVYNRSYAHFSEFQKAVSYFFRKKIPKIKTILHRRITENFQIIQPDFVHI